MRGIYVVTDVDKLPITLGITGGVRERTLHRTRASGGTL
jgi:hypothetical protein